MSTPIKNRQRRGHHKHNSQISLPSTDLTKEILIKSRFLRTNSNYAAKEIYKKHKQKSEEKETSFIKYISFSNNVNNEEQEQIMQAKMRCSTLGPEEFEPVRKRKPTPIKSMNKLDNQSGEINLKYQLQISQLQNKIKEYQLAKEQVEEKAFKLEKENLNLKNQAEKRIINEKYLNQQLNLIKYKNERLQEEISQKQYNHCIALNRLKQKLQKQRVEELQKKNSIIRQQVKQLQIKVDFFNKENSRLKDQIFILDYKLKKFNSNFEIPPITQNMENKDLLEQFQKELQSVKNKYWQTLIQLDGQRRKKSVQIEQIKKTKDKEVQKLRLQIGRIIREYQLIDSKTEDEDFPTDQQVKEASQNRKSFDIKNSIREKKITQQIYYGRERRLCMPLDRAKRSLLEEEVRLSLSPD